MYRKIEDFTRDWAYEIECTSRALNTLTDESLGQKVTPEGRSLGFLAWHIAITLGEMPEKVGLHIDAPAEDAPMPGTAAEIASAFETAANSVNTEVVKNWTDETLEQEDEMYGDKWKRGQPCLPDHTPGAPSRPDDGAYAAGGFDGTGNLRAIARGMGSLRYAGGGLERCLRDR